MNYHPFPSSRKEAKAKLQKRYFTGEPCKRGHVSERWTASAKCVACHYEENPLRPKRVWTKEERESAQKENKRRYYLKNKKLHLERGREWKRNNPEKVKESWARWRKQPKNKLITFMRDSVRRVLVREKSKRTEEYLGYTKDELRKHLEKQFQKGMDWNNYGEWHIDHIVSISELLKSGETRPEVINCLSNLRPMWAEENMKKNASRETLL